MAEGDGAAPIAPITASSALTARHEHLSQSAPKEIHSDFPMISVSDTGNSKRPRDARLIHMILSNYGVNAYQERVPLQLMDFAYRYTSSTLQDAVHFTSESYGTTNSGTTHAKNASAADDRAPLSLASIRLSIHSRTQYQFNPTLPKEIYSDIAQERNRIALPPVQREWGMQLPPEQYCMTGIGFDLKDEQAENEETEGLELGGSDDGAMGDERMLEDVDTEGGTMEDLFGGTMHGREDGITMEV